MKKILNYILTVLLLLAIPNLSKSQDSTYMKGIRLGCDLSRFALPLVQPGRKAAFEFSIDTEWKPKIFPTAEAGFENINLKNDFISYKSNSLYGRIGFDKNILKNDNNRYADMMFIGCRYGFSIVNHEVTSYSIHDIYEGISYSSFSAKTLQTHWLEFVTGTRAALTKFLFLGFSARIRFRVYSQKDINYPYIIPGYGNGEKKVNVGFNYSLFLQIPVKKVTYSLKKS